VMRQEFPCQVDLTQSVTDREVLSETRQVLNLTSKVAQIAIVFFSPKLEKAMHSSQK
jgi:hypothetical protein